MILPIRNSRIRLSQGQIFWREVGRGTALVFLHGSWQDGDQWMPVAEELSTRYHCFAPDLLGFGTSDRPKCHYSIDLEVECLSEYLESLRVRQVYLVGHSLGAWIAASYALRYPDLVKGLVLVSPEGVAVQGMKHRWARERSLTHRVPVGVWLLKLFSPVLGLMGRRETVQQSLQLRRQLLRSSTACKLLFNRRQSEIQSELLNEQVSWLKLPVLLLQGQHSDPAIAGAAQIYALAPKAMLQVLPGHEDDLLSIASTKVAEEIHEFIQSHLP